MSNKNREEKIAAAVACPACGAPIGRICRMMGRRPMACPERRAAWQAVRDARPPDVIVTGATRPAPIGHLHLAPQSIEAGAALRRIAGSRGHWDPVTGILTAGNEDTSAIVRSLIADGWMTTERL